MLTEVFNGDRGSQQFGLIDTVSGANVGDFGFALGERSGFVERDCIETAEAF